jgi:hypothetical protein
MSRPSNLIYGVADQPSAAICLCSAAQLAVLVGPPMTPDGVLRLAGYLLQNNADHIRAFHKADRAVLAIHFQH